jgi:ubiquinone/menaquinone biosynthesis C-methylase UbiE
MGYYDEIAESYEGLHKEEQLNKIRIIAEHLDIKPDDKVLDVGCGPGFAAEVIEADFTGIDPSAELVKKAPFRALVGCAEDLPFDDDSFDVVISITAIHNFDDIRKGLEEMRRVGKDRFAFSILKKSPKFDEIETLIRELFEVGKAIGEEKDVIFFCHRKSFK